VDVLARVRDRAPVLVGLSEENEQQRGLTPAAVSALVESGVFRMLVPRALGGLELRVSQFLEVLEEVSRADGAAGWCAMIGASTGVTSAYLAKSAAEKVYGDPAGVTGGVFAPSGGAVRVDGGYRVSGRWTFASGAQHCSWLQLGAVVMSADEADRVPGGGINARSMVLPRGAVEIIDTWDSAGLRGTGSHDVAVRDVFVPEEFSVSLAADRPWAEGTLYRFPPFGLLALGIAAVALGIARAAIDSLVELAGAKRPTGSGRLLAERPATQEAVAKAEGALRAARTFLFVAVEDAWATAAAGEPADLRQRAVLRLAATKTTRDCADVVDAMYDLGGGTSVYSRSPLQRQFRDIHVVTQHIMVALPTFEVVGRVLLGQSVDASTL
jgi:indole-3-acetate monooxygenase